MGVSAAGLCDQEQSVKVAVAPQVVTDNLVLAAARLIPQGTTVV